MQQQQQKKEFKRENKTRITQKLRNGFPQNLVE